MHNAYTASPMIRPTCVRLTVLPTIVFYMQGVLEPEIIAGKLRVKYPTCVKVPQLQSTVWMSGRPLIGLWYFIDLGVHGSRR